MLASDSGSQCQLFLFTWFYLYSQLLSSLLFFFFNDTPTTEIYTLSLHDALPIYQHADAAPVRLRADVRLRGRRGPGCPRSEEHTSELQSPVHLVCRLLLEKKNKEQVRPIQRQHQVDPVARVPPTKPDGRRECVTR